MDTSSGTLSGEPQRGMAHDHGSAPLNHLELHLQNRALASKPGVAFSNFYTPKNDLFYASSPYLELQAKRKEIRLLRVLPRRSYSEHLEAHPHWAPVKANQGQKLLTNDGSDTDTGLSLEHHGISNQEPLMACELVDNVPLSRINAEYCAISYCAGSPTDTATILVNGLPFNAFATLEHAVRCAQEAWEATHPGQDLLIWADQICINQRDHVERSHQVQMMREIYRRSEETFICLSTPNRVNHLDWIPPQLRQPPAKSDSSATLPRDALDEFQASFKTRFQVNGNIADDEQWLESLEAFTTCPWWRRSWVYQEFIVSPRPSFISGSNVVPWAKLSPMIDFLLPHLGQSLRNLQINFAPTIMERQERAKLLYEEQIAEAAGKHNALQDFYALELERHRELTSAMQKERNIGPTVEKLFQRCLNERTKKDNVLGEAKRILSSADHVVKEKDRVEQCRVFLDACREEASDEAACLDEESDGDEPADPATSARVSKAIERLADAERDLIDAEESLRQAHHTQKQDEGYIALLALPLQELIVALHGRDESVHCEDLRWDDIQWLVKSLCYSRHCALNGYPYRFEDNPEFWGYHPHHCKCIPRWNCYDGLATLKDSPIITKPESSWEPIPDAPSPPKPVPPPVYDEAQVRLQWAQQQDMITSLQDRADRLDFSPMTSMALGKKALRRVTDLKAVLRHSRSCLSSDPRDRIYAFLGLADSGYAIAANYTPENTIVHELINTAQKIISHEGSLDILYSAPLGRKNLGTFLPTWVPDWTSSARQCNLSKYYDALRSTDARPFRVSGDTPSSVAYRTDEANDTFVSLKVSGFAVDTISEIGEAVQLYPDVATFITAKGMRIATARALIDDQVWVLDGISMPVVLRPEGEHEYGFIKEAVILGTDNSISEMMYHPIEYVESKPCEVWLI